MFTNKVEPYWPMVIFKPRSAKGITRSRELWEYTSMITTLFRHHVIVHLGFSFMTMFSCFVTGISCVYVWICF